MPKINSHLSTSSSDTQLEPLLLWIRVSTSAYEDQKIANELRASTRVLLALISGLRVEELGKRP